MERVFTGTMTNESKTEKKAKPFVSANGYHFMPRSKAENEALIRLQETPEYQKFVSDWSLQLYYLILPHTRGY
jgi:hypothetical protein